MESIAIIDYGMSNLHSVRRALTVTAPADTRIRIARAATDIESADRVVFPGQGAARDCMKALADSGLLEPVTRAAREKPFLGICMGMQVLFERSLENDGTPCLDIFAGEVRHLSDFGAPSPGHKIPHLGWDQVRQRDHPLWHRIDDNAYFYFLHSYYPAPADDGIVFGACHYGAEFACAAASGFVFSVQFHPEKSAADGLQLLRNFCAWKGESQSC